MKKRKAVKRAVGRPSKFKEHYTKIAFLACEMGYTDKDLANFFNTTKPTLYAWQRRNPAFAKAIERGKTLADAKVAEALYRCGIGQEIPEIVTFIYGDGQIKQTVTYRHIPPNIRVCLFWLRNRQPEKWGNVSERDYSRNIDVSMDLDSDNERPP